MKKGDNITRKIRTVKTEILKNGKRLGAIVWRTRAMPFDCRKSGVAAIWTLNHELLD